MTKVTRAMLSLLATAGALVIAPAAQAAPCLVVTLTGASGPPPHNGLAGPGTLVRYGDDANDCRSVFMQFDAGRGTLMRLSQVDVQAAQLNAVFFTHMHSDPMEGFSDIVQMRWILGAPEMPKLDIVCAADAKSLSGPDLSRQRFAAHIDNAYELSGETAYRQLERTGVIEPAGPVAGLNVVAFTPKDHAEVVWTSGEVKVTAIRTTHVPESAAFRVDTPAPPRKTSTSDKFEKLAKGADVIVNTAIHPVLSPERGASTPPQVHHRQSNAADLGARRSGTGRSASC